MIQVDKFAKQYGRVEAVKGISFTAYEGEVLALLGPNGAGKSTTIKAITGLLRPSSGHILLKGHDVVKNATLAKANLGYIPDRPYLYQKLTARELLRFLSKLRNVENAEEKAQNWLEFFGLLDFANELIETFSHGMRQKLTFVAAMIHEPPVLVIDEPMVGLDPRAAIQVRELMKDYALKGNTVLLTTHSMEIAEAVAHRVVVLSKGQIAAKGTMADLKGKADENLEAIFLRLTQENALEEEVVPS